MANLLQLIEIQKVKSSAMNSKYNNVLNENKEIITACDTIKKHLSGTDIDKLCTEANNKIISKLSFRESIWSEKKSLPTKLSKIETTLGVVSDCYSLLSSLPQVKLSELRRIADKLNMVIIPINYTEIEKLFETQDNEKELKANFKAFRKALICDKTRNYQMYLLCPIDYYSVWQQIISPVEKSIYFSEYFDNISTYIELMIPAQKNLYLATQSNAENLKTLADSFNKNISNLNKKIYSISDKLTTVENKMMTELKKLNEKVENLEQKTNKLEADLETTQLQLQKQAEFIYRNLDPILFAVQEDIDVVNDDYNCLIGMCWGEDISDNYLEFKGIAINNKRIANIPLKETIVSLDLLKYKSDKNALDEDIQNFSREIKEKIWESIVIQLRSRNHYNNIKFEDEVFKFSKNPFIYAKCYYHHAKNCIFISKIEIFFYEDLLCTGEFDINKYTDNFSWDNSDHFYRFYNNNTENYSLSIKKNLRYAIENELNLLL